MSREPVSADFLEPTLAANRAGSAITVPVDVIVLGQASTRRQRSISASASRVAKSSSSFRDAIMSRRSVAPASA